jgi:hypothetical protein
MMKRCVALALTVACSAPVFAMQSARARKAPTLAERFPAPPGYSVEQDTESEGSRNFSTAPNVRGHILRRFVQAGDDGPAGVAEVAGYFADLLHDQNGFLFDDHLNSNSGRLDGRIPGPRPVWLHVEISDESNVVDIIALEEFAGSAHEMPVEEPRVPGSWATGERLTTVPAADRAAANGVRDALAALAAPAFRPYQGWAWQVTSEDLPDGALSTTSTYPYRVRVAGLRRSQACATCAVSTDTRGVTIFTVEVNHVEALGELDTATLATDGFFVDPGFVSTSQVTPFRSGGRILVTATGRPALFEPVTRDEYLQARIRYAESSGNSAGAGALRQELSGLSSEDKRAPATNTAGRRIAKLNAAYFTAGAGRATAQFLVIDVPWKYGVGDVSLYQRDLAETFLASAALTDLLTAGSPR